MTAPFFFPLVASRKRDTSRARARGERIGSFLAFVCLLFLCFDGSMKLLRLAPAVEGTVAVGYSSSVVFPLGVVLLAATLLTAIPRTRIFGAILLTAYLGGATATHVRAGQPFFFPIVFGILIWVSIWLRDGQFRALLWRSK